MWCLSLWSGTLVFIYWGLWDWKTLQCSFLLGQHFLDGQTDTLRFTARYFLSSWHLSPLSLAFLFFQGLQTAFSLFSVACVYLCVLSSFFFSLDGNTDVLEANHSFELELFQTKQIYLLQNAFLVFGGPPSYNTSGILVKKKMIVLATQLHLTLCHPMDCSWSGSSVHGISQARIVEWVAIPFSRGFSQPRDQTWVSSTAGRFFTIWATRRCLS